MIIILAPAPNSMTPRTKQRSQRNSIGKRGCDIQTLVKKKNKVPIRMSSLFGFICILNVLSGLPPGTMGLQEDRTKIEGVVTSPNYPGSYPNNVRRTEMIEVEQGHRISLKFTAFNVEYGGRSCVWDYLRIVDGDGTTLLQKHCGTTKPATIISRSNIIRLHFKTDSSVTKSGWRATWSSEGRCLKRLFDMIY